MSPLNKHWFAIYTHPRHEKKVFESLTEIKIEAYLPLQKKLRKWSDRKKWVETPLITSYVFVNVDEKSYYDVLKIQGASRYICFEGKAATIPDWQINAMKLALEIDPDLEITNKKFNKGDNIIVIDGPFIGLKGKLIDFKGKKKVLINISNIGQSLVVNIPVEYLEKKTKAKV